MIDPCVLRELTGFLGNVKLRIDTSRVKRSLCIKNEKLIVVHVGNRSDGFNILKNAMLAMGLVKTKYKILVSTGKVISCVGCDSLKYLLKDD